MKLACLLILAPAIAHAEPSNYADLGVGLAVTTAGSYGTFEIGAAGHLDEASWWHVALGGGSALRDGEDHSFIDARGGLELRRCASICVYAGADAGLRYLSSTASTGATTVTGGLEVVPRAGIDLGSTLALRIELSALLGAGIERVHDTTGVSLGLGGFAGATLGLAVVFQ